MTQDKPGPGPTEKALSAEIRRRRETAGFSQAGLATALGYTRQYVARAEHAGQGLVSDALIERIDGVLRAESALIDLHRRAKVERENRRRPVTRVADDHVGRDDTDITTVMAEISLSDISDSSIAEVDEAVVSLAESHTQVPPRILLREVLGLHLRGQTLLRNRLRLSQRRDLYRIEADLLAHACLLLGDLGRTWEAEQFGTTSLAYAREAGAGQALACSALAKTLRWAERFVESAEMARRGFEQSANCPIRIQLACQEANAAALLGHASRAQEALVRAETAAAATPSDSGTSAWSFPRTRHALFAQSVARNTGDHEAALAATEQADDCWRHGDPFVMATFAQIRVGAAMAHVEGGAVDVAAQDVEAVAQMSPHLRVSTVTGYMTSLLHALRADRLAGSSTARELVSRCCEFNAAALPRSQPETAL